MSGCSKCKGVGQVRDLSWCGDPACCPEFLTCLACQPHAPTAVELAAEHVREAFPDVPVFTDLVYHYDPAPPEPDYPQLDEGDVVQIRDRETGEVVGHATVGPRVQGEPTVFEVKFGPQS